MKVLGTLPLSIVCARFSDGPPPPWEPSATDDVARRYADLIGRSSMGRAWVSKTGTFGWAVMPRTLAWYDENQPLVDVRQPDGTIKKVKLFFKRPDGLYWGEVPAVLHDDGMFLANQLIRAAGGVIPQHLVAIFYAGIGTYGEGGGGYAHLGASQKDSLESLAHEGGHAIGLLHSASLHPSQPDGTQAPPDLNNLRSGGYWITGNGDSQDPMGIATGHHCAVHKSLLGWIDPARTRWINQSTTFVLGNIETGAGTVLEARIPTGVPEKFYSIEKRAAGVFVRLRSLDPAGIDPLTGRAIYVWADTYLLRWGRPITLLDPFVDAVRGITVRRLLETDNYAIVRAEMRP